LLLAHDDEIHAIDPGDAKLAHQPRSIRYAALYRRLDADGRTALQAATARDARSPPPTIAVRGPRQRSRSASPGLVDAAVKYSTSVSSSAN